MTQQEQNAAAEQARKDGNVDPNAAKNPFAPLDQVKVPAQEQPKPTTATSAAKPA